MCVCLHSASAREAKRVKKGPFLALFWPDFLRKNGLLGGGLFFQLTQLFLCLYTRALCGWKYAWVKQLFPYMLCRRARGHQMPIFPINPAFEKCLEKWPKIDFFHYPSESIWIGLKHSNNTLYPQKSLLKWKKASKNDFDAQPEGALKTKNAIMAKNGQKLTFLVIFSIFLKMI